MRRFPIWEILMVILVVFLVYLLGKPQYMAAERTSNDYTVFSNMFTLRAAVENYAAYNAGAFPKSASQIEEYLSILGEKIVNPYTKEEIRFPEITVTPQGDTAIIEGDVMIFQYEFREEPKERSVDSRNGRLKGKPGGLAYGYFIPPGDTVAGAYGIVGFDGDGKPIADKNPAGVIELRVLTES